MFLTTHKRTYTSTNLYNQEFLRQISFFLEKIELAKQEYASEMPEDVECMLHLGRDEDDTVYECYYYLVDHTNRILFWMNNFSADDMIGEIDGVTDARHISMFFPGLLALSSPIHRMRTREKLLVGSLDTLVRHYSCVIGTTGIYFRVLGRYRLLSLTNSPGCWSMLDMVLLVIRVYSYSRTDAELQV
jgi:hypothetical protein